MPMSRSRQSSYAIPMPILVQSELSPQINPTDVFVAGQAFRRPAAEDHAVVHDVRAVGNAQRFTDVVIGDQHADSPVPQVKDDLLDVADRDRIDARERL